MTHSGERALPPGAKAASRVAAAAAAVSDRSLFSAERLRLLESAVVNSYDSIVITDTGTPSSPHPRILFVNDAFTRLAGYTAAEVLGRSPSLLQGPGSDRAEIARMRTCLAHGEVFTSELINYRKDGTPFHVEVRIMPILAADGRLSHWVGVQRDITARIEAAAERERLEGRLREQQKLESLGVLAGGIAHDFNNLLTIILGNASLARANAGSPQALAQNLQFIESAVLRAADLCRQMLAYSGQGRFAVRPLQLNPLLHETAELVRDSAAHGRTLEFALADALPAVRADATQLKQVAMNLLLNAAEATEAGTGHIRVSTRREPLASARLARARLGAELPAGDYLVLEVADNGCGIPVEIQDRLFDPFFTTKFTGRGLGLAAVLGIVRAHHGAIEIESRPGAGARFRILLPACADPAAPAAPRRATATLAGAGRTLLVADDERVLRETIGEFLTSLGFKVHLAADGREAVALYRAHHRDMAAVLLDLSMPHLDGAAAHAEMQAIDPACPVILMSGYSEDEAVQRLTSRGTTRFLQKPFAMAVLLDALAAVLKTR